MVRRVRTFEAIQKKMGVPELRAFTMGGYFFLFSSLLFSFEGVYCKDSPNPPQETGQKGFFSSRPCLKNLSICIYPLILIEQKRFSLLHS